MSRFASTFRLSARFLKASADWPRAPWAFERGTPSLCTSRLLRHRWIMTIIMTFRNTQGGPWERGGSRSKQFSMDTGVQISWCVSSDGTTLTCQICRERFRHRGRIARLSSTVLVCERKGRFIACRQCLSCDVPLCSTIQRPLVPLGPPGKQKATKNRQAGLHEQPTLHSVNTSRSPWMMVASMKPEPSSVR